MTHVEFMRAMLRPAWRWLWRFELNTEKSSRSADAQQTVIDALVRRRARELGMVDPKDAIGWTVEDAVGSMGFLSRHEAERFVDTHTLAHPVVCAVVPLA